MRSDSKIDWVEVREEGSGRWFSADSHSFPHVDVYVNHDPEISSEDPSISLVWRGALSPDTVVQWLMAMSRLTDDDGDCYVEIPARDGIESEREVFHPPFEKLRSNLSYARGEIVVQPATKQFGFYLCGPIGIEKTTPSFEFFPDIEFSLSRSDATSVNAPRLVAELMTSTSGKEIQPDDMKLLFGRVHNLAY